MTPIQKTNFIAEHSTLSGNTNEMDYKRAEFFHRLRKVLPDRIEFMLFCTGVLEQGGSQAAKHWKMAAAYERVTALHTWRAIGWRGVSMLDQVKQDDNFSKIQSRVCALYTPTDGMALKRSVWMSIFEKIAPDVVALQKAKRSKAKATTSNDGEARANLLAATIKRLLQAAPILRSTLSAAELKAAGLEAKATRKTG